TSVISPNPVTPGNSATITVSNLGSVSPGDYSMQLVGTSTVGERTLDLGLSVQLPVTNAPTLVSPANNSNNVSLLPTLDWNAVAQAAQYEVQISTTPTFTNVVAMATVSTANWVSTVGLSTQTEYYWRVRGVNSGCGAGPFSAVRQFRTGNCGDFVSTETITISASGTPLIVSSITVPAINITEVTLPNIRGTHTWSADLDISIRSPQGTSVSLMEDLCDDNNDFNIGFSDSSPNAYANITCNPTGNGLVYRPLGTLADFNGESSEGDWVLNIQDDASQDGGQLQTWSITVCGSSIAPALSVTWLNIATTTSATAIAVEWEVTNELDVEEYIVERRAESETDFKAIGTVAGTNKNSEAVVKYSFTDDNAELGQTYYYRVRQVEYSGQASLSPIRYAAIQGVVAQQLIAFPNPVSDRVYIEMTNTNRGKVELELLDTTGKVVRRIETRTNRVEWDVTQLPTGLYYLKSNGAIQAVTKVVIR
ncbi:MAG: T9SS type A sorting domain-containing protein, partial [Bacteroidota bacterium]